MKRFALVAALMLSITGCGNELVPKNGGSMEEQRAELLRRPSIEEASARYLEMNSRVQEEINKSFPGMLWEKKQETVRAGCADFDAFADTAEGWSLEIWMAKGNLPDADWPRAEKIFADVTADYGFGPPKPIVNRPADHEVTVFDPYGATYSFGTAANTLLSGNTGCHLPQAEKDKHAPPPAQ